MPRIMLGLISYLQSWRSYVTGAYNESHLLVSGYKIHWCLPHHLFIPVAWYVGRGGTFVFLL